MDPLQRVEGLAAPLLVHGIDTDTITPMKRLLEGGDALVRYAFEPLRYLPDGSENPDFVLNQERYRGAPILLAGPNFGCGSSRETAVWAIAGLGFRCVIAASFGDIFYTNCFQNGVLPIVLDAAEVEALATEARTAAEAGGRFVVDLQRCAIETPTGRTVGFQVPPLRREMLLRGLDQIEMTLERSEDIARFQQQDQLSRPYVYQLAALHKADG